jgi:hypothetical protein
MPCEGRKPHVQIIARAIDTVEQLIDRSGIILVSVDAITPQMRQCRIEQAAPRQHVYVRGIRHDLHGPCPALCDFGAFSVVQIDACQRALGF